MTFATSSASEAVWRALHVLATWQDHVILGRARICDREAAQYRVSPPRASPSDASAAIRVEDHQRAGTQKFPRSEILPVHS